MTPVGTWDGEGASSSCFLQPVMPRKSAVIKISKEKCFIECNAPVSDFKYERYSLQQVVKKFVIKLPLFIAHTIYSIVMSNWTAQILNGF